MIVTLFGHMTDIGPLAYVLVAGVMATAVWRLAGVLVGGRLSTDHPLFEWARAVALSIVAAQASLLVVTPMGPIADVPLALRLLAVLLGFAAYHFTARNVLIGVAVGDAIVLAALALR